jgi:outer membrane murein-binding lipoprotein Lpp
MRGVQRLEAEMTALSRDIEALLLEAKLTNLEAERGRARIEAIKARLRP